MRLLPRAERLALCIFSLSWTASLFLPTCCHAAATEPRDLKTLSSTDAQSLINARDPLKGLDPSDPASHLSKILIPRPPDTENNTLVRNYIVSTLKALDWHVELDQFTGNTPYGAKHMANIIATKDPSAPRRLILSAHFDSKYFPNYPDNQFVGATDSAMSCAMMLDLAETLNTLLNKRKERYENGEEDDEEVADTTLQLVFFDGEEAFKDWTEVDSIYGARNLAEKWSTTYIPPTRKRHFINAQENELGAIEHLILLDLLGAANPRFRSYWLETAWLFDALADAERRLGESGAFAYGDEQSMASGKWKSWFRPRHAKDSNMGYIGDDHVPFLARGVPILHLISDPFPLVWHTLRDDGSALDRPTMRRWNILMRVFLSEYLNLQPNDLTSRDASDDPFSRNTSELP
ncbi:hypothetical protein CPB83DRAFT_856862 [Crepidotus variabilis]|uniref:Peptide hydrolase n=1 Tax=Crepidotus variabilis TaxID=179855 RepID=A0A9P6EDE6_9AGAR|nr:hypothetical protein CPB83DRAFT_856862 [Crepidotus variabilis]